MWLCWAFSFTSQANWQFTPDLLSCWIVSSIVGSYHRWTQYVSLHLFSVGSVWDRLTDTQKKALNLRRKATNWNISVRSCVFHMETSGGPNDTDSLWQINNASNPVACVITASCCRKNSLDFWSQLYYLVRLIRHCAARVYNVAAVAITLS